MFFAAADQPLCRRYYKPDCGNCKLRRRFFGRNPRTVKRAFAMKKSPRGFREDRFKLFRAQISGAFLPERSGGANTTSAILAELDARGRFCAEEPYRRRGNHTKRIHDRGKRKVFYHAKRGNVNTTPPILAERRMLHIAERKRSNASSVKAKYDFMKRRLRAMKRFWRLHASACQATKNMKRFAALPQSMKRSLDAPSCFFAFFAGKKAKKMVVGDGFEPSNSSRADLQSAAFDRSAIPPRQVERVTGVEPV